MNSMTGFGKADFRKDKLAVSVAITSVNSRFLEFTLRLPKQIAFMEPKFKELIASKLNRGKITLTLNYEDYGSGVDKLVINEKMADEYYRQLKNLKKKYKLEGAIEISHFMGFPELFKLEKVNELEKRIWPPVKQAITIALKDLVAMRRREGENLKIDLASRVKYLTAKITEVEKLAAGNIPIYRERLAKKIAEVMGNKSTDGLRLEEEIVFMAERSDITEECIRFESHLKQFAGDLKKRGPVGKRLNFLLQELNRETNTIGAKAGNTEVAKLVLLLKEEIEKIREQVQNIE
jgi:uncharacterized protein (TIGR00255 family)